MSELGLVFKHSANAANTELPLKVTTLLFLFSTRGSFSHVQTPHKPPSHPGADPGTQKSDFTLPLRGRDLHLTRPISRCTPRSGKETRERKAGKRRGDPQGIGPGLPTSFRYCPAASLFPSLWTSFPAPAPPPEVFSCRCAWPCVTRKRREGHDT